MNPAYQPATYDRAQQEHRRYLSDVTDRSGYRSDDPHYHDRSHDRSRNSRSDRRDDDSDDERGRGRRHDGYMSEPDQRRDRSDMRNNRSRDRNYIRDDRSREYIRDDRSHDRTDVREDRSRDQNYIRDDRSRDKDRFYKQDDRHDPDYYHYDRDSRPHYDPREHPYYYPSKDMFHPPVYPERDPRFHPYFRYEGDMHRQPFYMYNPMDVYAHQFRSGPHDYYMGQPHPYRQFNHPRTKRPMSKKSKKSKKDAHVEFDEEVEERDFDPNEVDPYLVAEIEKSKLRARLGLLIFLILLLIASVVIGAIASALEPWWYQEDKSGKDMSVDCLSFIFQMGGGSTKTRLILYFSGVFTMYTHNNGL